MNPREIEIPILTAGGYGAAGDWPLERLRRIARSYDAERAAAPLVLGHPAHDAPAHGWVRALRVAGSRLWARIGDLSEEAVRLVREGRYRRVSAAFHPGSGEAPPRLKHVGLLGAASPRDPSLPMVAFSEEIRADEAGPAEGDPLRFLSAEAAGWLGRLARALLRWLERRRETEEAPEPETAPEAGSAGAETAAVFSEAIPETAVPDRIERALEALIAQGRLPPVFRDRGGARFLASLPAAPGVAFADSPAALSPADWFLETARAFPARLFGEAMETQADPPLGPEERLYRRAYERLDAQQSLRARGVGFDLFRKVYAPRDCRAILAGPAGLR